MRARELKELLDEVPDTRELVLRRAVSAAPAWGALYDAWSDACEETGRALSSWQRRGGCAAYCAYRAAQDREDAAQDALYRAVADDRIAQAVAAVAA
jgi:hypothetical protein